MNKYDSKNLHLMKLSSKCKLLQFIPINIMIWTLYIFY